MRWRPVSTLFFVMALACGADESSAPPLDGLTVPEGFEVEVVADGFDGPTQVAAVGDGSHVVAQLGGGERDGVGTIEKIDFDTDARTTLVEGLLTPTGVAVWDDDLWIMEQRTLTVGPLDDPGDRTVVADDLPFNGRSEGTLTVVDDTLYFDTSGRRSGFAAADGSGRLFAVDPDGTITEFAEGFKHAYAHAPAGDGALWVTEMSDGRYDGAPANDELVRLRSGDDGGWPQCVGDRVPVVEYDATPARCATTVASHALFPPGATPTSVAVAPWDDGATLLVALWVTGEVVTVPAAEPDGAPHEPTTFLADGDGVLVVDHASGRIVRITPER